MASTNNIEEVRNTVMSIRKNYHHEDVEIILLDTLEQSNYFTDLAELFDAKWFSSSSKKIHQLLNEAVEIAEGTVYFFIEPNTLLSKNFQQEIIKNITAGIQLGTFKNHNFYHNKFISKIVRKLGFTLKPNFNNFFISKECFYKLSGFEAMHLEDPINKFISQAQNSTSLKWISLLNN